MLFSFCINKIGVIHCVPTFVQSSYIRCVVNFGVGCTLFIQSLEKTDFSLFSFFFLFGVAGSQWQPNIWPTPHVRHSWPSYILSTYSCRSWSCSEQVSCWIPVGWSIFCFSIGDIWGKGNWNLCISWPVISACVRIYQCWKWNWM